MLLVPYLFVLSVLENKPEIRWVLINDNYFSTPFVATSTNLYTGHWDVLPDSCWINNISHLIFYSRNKLTKQVEYASICLKYYLCVVCLL